MLKLREKESKRERELTCIRKKRRGREGGSAWKRRRDVGEKREPRRVFPPRTSCLEPLPAPPTHTHALFLASFVVKKKKKRHHHLSAGKKSHLRIEQGKCIRLSIAFIYDSIFPLEDSLSSKSAHDFPGMYLLARRPRKVD